MGPTSETRTCSHELCRGRDICKHHEFNYEDWHWQSDWMGDEVGYDNPDLIVGLYTHKETGKSAYIDVENEKILDWLEEEEE